MSSERVQTIKKVLIVYHSVDMDGYCSAAIALKKFPDAVPLGWNYGDPIPDVSRYNYVYLLDVSFPLDIMNKIGQSHKLILIDHHKSVIDEIAKYKLPLNFEHYLDSNYAACELTWKYFYDNEQIPEIVTLLGAYDSWRNTDEVYWNEYIVPFQYGMRVICNGLHNFTTWLLNTYDTTLAEIQRIIDSGRMILEYQRNQNESTCKKASFDRKFNGFNAVCLNSSLFNSQVFDSVYNPDKHDIMIAFQFNGEKWVVSLYTTHNHIDCSVLAKARGGGGHKGAAGFLTNDISEIIK